MKLKTHSLNKFSLLERFAILFGAKIQVEIDYSYEPSSDKHTIISRTKFFRKTKTKVVDVTSTINSKLDMDLSVIQRIRLNSQIPDTDIPSYFDKNKIYEVVNVRKLVNKYIVGDIQIDGVVKTKNVIIVGKSTLFNNFTNPFDILE